MSHTPEEVVTAVAIAEATGLSDGQLRELADALKRGESPADPAIRSILRLASAYSVVRRRFGRTSALKVIDQVFDVPEHKGLVHALHQVSPCIVPLDLD